MFVDVTGNWTAYYRCSQYRSCQCPARLKVTLLQGQTMETRTTTAAPIRYSYKLAAIYTIAQRLRRRQLQSQLSPFVQRFTMPPKR